MGILWLSQVVRVYEFQKGWIWDSEVPIQFSSVTQSYLTLCDPMNRSTPGLPVHHQLPEFTQTHVHQVGDAIQPSNPLSAPSPPALNLSQNQGIFPMSQLFPSGGQSIGVLASTSVPPMNTLDWSPLGWTGWISLQSKGLSRVFSNTTVQKHQFFGTQLSFSPTLTSIHDCWKTIALTRRTFVGKVTCLLFNMLSRLVIPFLPRSKRLLFRCFWPKYLESVSCSAASNSLKPHSFLCRWDFPGKNTKVGSHSLLHGILLAQG